MQKCLNAELVIFSGLKADKLDDLEAVIARKKAKIVFVAGSLAMALKKAEAKLAGKPFCAGVAENPAHAEKPYYIEGSRFEQAERILTEGRKNGVRFVLPVDFTLATGLDPEAKVWSSETLSPTDQQFDVGPRSNLTFASAIGDYIAECKASGKQGVAFHNGVFGMFEDPRFEGGTKSFVPQFRRMTEAGIEVYIGGGEGGASLDKYGQPDWVTHCFTAGGTVLNALGKDPIPYLVALRMAAKTV